MKGGVPITAAWCVLRLRMGNSQYGGWLWIY